MATSVKKLREQKGWTKAQLARALDTYPQQIDKLEHPERRLNEVWLERLSKVFNVQPTDLMSSPGAASTPSAWTAPEPQTPYMPQNSQNMVPVYGQASCGPDGQFEMNGQIVDHQPRPWSLANVPDAYALYVEGSSMDPRYKEGEVVFIHPGRKPRAGADVVVQLHPLHDGDPPRAFIKEYVSGNLLTITLRQYGEDPKTFSVQREQIVSVHVIIARGEPA